MNYKNISTLLIIILLSSCVEENQVKSSIEKVRKSRVNLVNASYSNLESKVIFEDLKTYLNGLNDFSSLLDEHKNKNLVKVKILNSLNKKSPYKYICSILFKDFSRLIKIKKQCLSREFNLCPRDIAIVGSLKKSLIKKLKVNYNKIYKKTDCVNY